jgi:amino acid transporter
MSDAYVEVHDRELLKTLRWWDGFVVSLAVPGFLISALGFTYAVLGTWGTVFFWTLSMILGACQAYIYSEPALMFPNKSGGIALYANEAWKSKSTLIGPIITFGYWFGWSAVLAINGLLIGTLIQAQWFANSTWSYSDGLGHITLAKVIGIVCIVAVWLLNTRGMRIGVNLTYVTGALLLIPLAVIMFGAFVSGNFHASNMSWSVHGWNDGWKVALVWLYLMGWSAYGVEGVASFGPEYKQLHDTRKALISASAFSLVVFFFLPLGVAGTLSLNDINAGANGQYVVTALTKIIGAGSGVATILLIAGLLLAMNTATMDGSRALYGISRGGMTIKQLGVLNKHHVPGRAMTVDSIFNILLLLVFDSNLVILAASNLGYIVAHIFALSGVIMLRRSRPDWPRPFKLHSIWLVLAALLAIANLGFTVIAFADFSATGYASGKNFLGIPMELVLGPVILLVGAGLFVFRRTVQDKMKFIWRDTSEQVPLPVEVAEHV